MHIDYTEEAILNPHFPPEGYEEFDGWRMYRIEYGGFNEACFFEGRLLLPPNADPDTVIEIIYALAKER